MTFPRESAVIESPPAGVWLLIGLGLAGAWGLWVAILFYLRAILRTMKWSRPFVHANAVRIRTMGWLVLTYQVASWIAVFYLSRLAPSEAGRSGVQLPSDGWEVFLLGLILLVLAAVFRTGARLAEEQALTI